MISSWYTAPPQMRKNKTSAISVCERERERSQMRKVRKIREIISIFISYHISLFVICIFAGNWSLHGGMLHITYPTKLRTKKKVMEERTQKVLPIFTCLSTSYFWSSWLLQRFTSTIGPAANLGLLEIF